MWSSTQVPSHTPPLEGYTQPTSVLPLENKLRRTTAISPTNHTPRIFFVKKQWSDVVALTLSLWDWELQFLVYIGFAPRKHTVEATGHRRQPQPEPARTADRPPTRSVHVAPPLGTQRTDSTQEKQQTPTCIFGICQMKCSAGVCTGCNSRASSTWQQCTLKWPSSLTWR